MYRTLALVLATAMPLLADMSADEVKAKVKEGGDHFRAAMAASDKQQKMAELGKMTEAFTVAFGETKQDAAASAQVEEEAGGIKSADEKALFFFFVCDGYCQLERWKPALDWIEKALALSKNAKYEAKKKEIEDKLK